MADLKMDMDNAVHIILNPRLVEHTNQPARRHRKKRIAKKWLKRYGRRTIPDANVYVFDGNVMMHPAIYKKLADAVGEEEAVKGLQNIMKARTAEMEEGDESQTEKRRLD